MAQLHLVLGPVGAGKSTFVRQLCVERRAVPLRLDEWTTVLFSPDRPKDGVIPWYVERAERCVEQIWRVTSAILDAGTDVVLEVGLIRRSERESFYGRVDADARDLKIHVLDAPRDVRRRRVEQRNQDKGETFSMEVPPDVFELCSDLWEPLTEVEENGRDVRRISTA